MTIRAQAAPSQGFAKAVAVTVSSTSKRKPLSAASTIAKGLSRISTLIALEARNTMKKASIAMGTRMELPNHERSMAARNPLLPGREESGAAD